MDLECRERNLDSSAVSCSLVTDTEITVIGGSYKIGPGAKLTFSFEDAEKDNVSGTDVDADFLGVGLLLKF